MHFRVKVFAAVFVVILAAATVVGVIDESRGTRQDEKPGSGWQLPPDARDTKNPIAVDEKVLAAGKKVFSDKCQKCHGPKGLGDGPDADPEHAEDMDLTNGKRADRNPDGVVFYKVMNGRKKPKMPAFKDELTKEQVWSVVSYVQTLRKK
jgi:mono/diheme cytochrome c family protein